MCLTQDCLPISRMGAGGAAVVAMGRAVLAAGRLTDWGEVGPAACEMAPENDSMRPARRATKEG